MDKNICADNGIAIIAMNCRFPGIKNTDQLWEILEKGKEAIKPSGQTQAPGDTFIPLKTELEGSDLFDADFFGFNELDAQITDPQQRIFLECAWEVMEKAGYNPLTYKGLIGIYAGVSTSTYLIANLLSNGELINSISELQIMIGNDKDHLTSQVAYKMDLKGPCATIQSACSSSLTAVHFACESLLSGQSDMMIAGGVTIKYPERNGYHYKQGGLVSKDGHLRAFDSNASGTVYSNGIAMVVLKRVEDALKDGDHIYAIIKGTAIGNDGAARIGYTAPGVDGQVAVITEAQTIAGVSPETISYIEAHGSGTPLGDSIEVQALTRAFRRQTNKKGFCAIGSVKTNLGHVEMAAGVTGLIKTVLALEHNKIPPSLHFEEPNPDLLLHDSPFYVNSFLTDWATTDNNPRRAAVSSFGLGGSNVHVVVEEAPKIHTDSSNPGQDILLISTKTEKALEEASNNLIKFIEQNPQTNINDIAYTLKVGRVKHDIRKAWVINDRESFLESIKNNTAIAYRGEHDFSTKTITLLLSDTPFIPASEFQNLYLHNQHLSNIIVDLSNQFEKQGGNLFYIMNGEKKESPYKSMVYTWIQNYAIVRLLVEWGLNIEKVIGNGINGLTALAITNPKKLNAVIQLLCTSLYLKNITYTEAGELSRALDQRVSPEQILDGTFWKNPDVLSNHSSHKALLASAQNEIVVVAFTKSDLVNSTGVPVYTLFENRIDKPVYEELQSLLAYLWVNNYSIDWSKYYNKGKYQRISLPTYPFQRKRYWVDFNDFDHISIKSYELAKSISASALPFDIPADKISENKIVAIWERNLGQRISNVKDNFFELGGHSLLATQILFELRREFEVDVPLQRFFENPTIQSLTQIISELKSLKEKDFEALPLVKPDLANRYNPFPLTDIQTAYWLGRNSGMELGNISTHMYFENDAKELDLVRFNAAFQKMIDRHEMLRAVILPDGTQKVLKDVPEYTIEINDFEELSKEQLDSQITKIRDEMSHQVLDCYQWPLFNIKASRLPGNVTRLHISIDLLIVDAWSLELLMNDLSNEYHGLQHKTQNLELSFRDYIVALKKIDDSKNFEKSREYWLKRIETLPPAPQLTLSKDPAQIANPKFRRLKYVLKKDQWQSIREKARSSSLTPTTVLVSAFSEILSLWSRKPHFTLNLTLFNRLPLHEEVNEILGDFTSLTLLEINFKERSSFQNRAKAVQKRLLEDIDYRYFSGTRVTRELINKYKDPSRAIIPIIFTSILNQLESKWEPADSYFDDGKAQEEDRYSISQTPQVWIDHQVIERDGALHYNWDVVEELFPQGMIDEMFHSYCQLLEMLASNPSSWDSATPVSNNKECFPYFQQLGNALSVHNNTGELPKGLLHEGFQNQVIQQPNSVALCAGEMQITYRELNNCANKIAAQLIANNTKPNELIAIIMDKGWEQAAAAIGILKSGAAYLPIDASNPTDRINHLIKIGKVRTAIVPSQSIISNISDSVSIITVTADLLNYGGPDIFSTAMNTDLAYVIFTSGSTGTPKGVMIDHRGALNTIVDINDNFSISNQDVVFGISSLSFDLSVYDLFGTLAAGGKLVLPDHDKLRDPWHWKELIEAHQVTVWNSVPALMNMLVDYLGEQASETFSSLRLVLLSGDWIPVGLPDEIKQANTDIQVISLGGATEGSIWSILYPIQSVKESWKSIPYGISMKNQRILVLNERLEDCPVNVKGELYIGGIGVALGYWGDDEKTNERFIVHPETQERLYRTGDMGRYMEDGLIEFLGREDLQVKIGGYRIELGEIESVLKQHEYIADAAVLLTGKNGTRQLSAFVKLDKEKSLGIGGLNDENIILDPIKRMEFKLQQKARRYDLLQNKAVELSLLDNHKAIIERRSYRLFEQEEIPFRDFSQFLSCLSQYSIPDIPFPKYYYGSGGGLYPIQIYLYVKKDKIEGVQEGVYYYDSKGHRLYSISTKIKAEDIFHLGQNKSIYDNSGFSIFLVGKKDAIEPLYGLKDSLGFMYLEAGMITQLLEMKSTEFNIGFCQIGKINSDIIKPFLNIGENYVYFHCLVGGKISPLQKTQEGYIKEFSEYKTHSHDSTEKAEKPIESIDEIIKGYLMQSLPHYMIPSKINLIDSFPLTENGKVNRKALLAEHEEIKRKQLDTIERVLPNNEIEEKLIQIWKEEFPQEEFGVRDNFFDLGGNSVSIVTIFGKVQKAFGNVVTMVDLFRYPTIEGIAELLLNSQPQSIEAQLKEEDNRAAARKNAIRKMKAVNS